MDNDQITIKFQNAFKQFTKSDDDALNEQQLLSFFFALVFYLFIFYYIQTDNKIDKNLLLDIWEDTEKNKEKKTTMKKFMGKFFEA